MSQKSRFKMQTQGITTFRKAFPQLPGGTLKNPTFIQTAHGNRLLTSGWWAWSRKPVSPPLLLALFLCLHLFTELRRRLDDELHLGRRRRLRHPHPVLLLGVLHHRPRAPLWA